MKTKHIKLFLIFFILTGFLFTTCHNTWMDPWWPRGEEETFSAGVPSGGSGDNFAMVVFNTNGGTPQPQALKVAWGNPVGRLRPISRGNDGFLGWFDEKNDPWDVETRSVTQADDVNSDGFITLTIKWVTVVEPTAIYTVKFIPYPDVPIQTKVVSIPDQYIAAGGKVVRPVDPPRLDDGRGFAGWYTDNTYSSTWDFNIPVAQNAELYAKWDIDTRTVRFEANGGMRPDGTTVLTHEFTVAISYGLVQDPGPLVKEGYSFDGWYYESSFTTIKWNFATKLVTDSEVKDMKPLILYAKWVKNKYIVSFMIDPSIDAPPAPQIVEHGNRVAQPDNPRPLGDGREFLGWYMEDSFQNKWNFNNPVTATMKLYAQFAPVTRTVAFNVNGGGDMPRTHFSIPLGNKILDPGNPVRTGFIFKGWYFDPACTPGNSINFSTYIVTAPDEVIAHDPLYLYAGWTPAPSTVTFNLSGSSVPNQSVQYGERIKIPENITNPGNKTLDGWYKNSNFTNLWDFDIDTVTSNITLYARWLDASYVVRYYLGTGSGDSSGKIPQWGTQAGKPYLEQYYRAGDKVIEPSMPALPASDTTSWSFLRWDVRIIPNTTDVANQNDSDWRSALQPLNNWSVSFPNYLTEGGLRVINLYARWVPPVPDMVWVPRGSFEMGDSSVSGTPAAYHAYPTRRVRVDGFYISKYEVTEVNSPNNTIRSYTSVMGTNPSQFSGNTNRPVEKVSWYDAIDYCMKLSSIAGLSQVYSMSGISTAPISGTGSPGIQSITNATVTQTLTGRTGYRLPTEAEWEYAARGGNGSPGSFTYSGSNIADTVAWYNLTVQAQMSGSQATQPAGSKLPNGLGIYDMSGNVSEWVWDWFGSYKDSYYSTSAAGSNPIGPPSGTEKVRRGGGWSNAAGNVRSVVRNSQAPGVANWVVGFRVVRAHSTMW